MVEPPPEKQPSTLRELEALYAQLRLDQALVGDTGAEDREIDDVCVVC